MNAALKEETEKLERSWMRHDAAMLRDYLVASVEDPRINLQSIFSRHFLLREFFEVEQASRLSPAGVPHSNQQFTNAPEQFGALMEQEYRFAAVMNWLVELAGPAGEAEELAAVHHALARGADNLEGLEIPRFVLRTFAALPTTAGDLTVSNYIASFLSGAQFANGQPRLHEASLDTFRTLWNQALADLFPISSRNTDPAPLAPKSREGAPPPQPLSVLEPACGSANDYRFLQAYGLAPLLDYTGFDLCAKNIENARALFPGVRFEVGNVFEIAAPDKTFDLCFIHDLFEHLSLEGLNTAIREVCRVTRWGLCIGFFNMDEIPEHRVCPVDEYHWNTLSMARMRELFATYGFAAQVLHVGTFLRQQIGCEHTHNANAYTFILRK
jgi:SAM-dependent methyltransferase